MIRGQLDQDRGLGGGIQLAHERCRVVTGCLAGHGVEEPIFNRRGHMLVRLELGAYRVVVASAVSRRFAPVPVGFPVLHSDLFGVNRVAGWQSFDPQVEHGDVGDLVP